MKKALGLLIVLLAASVSGASSREAEPAAASEEKKEFMDRFDAANAMFSEDKIQEAAEAYRSLLKENLLPSTWGKVTFNLGIAQMRLSHFKDAIETLETIFPSKVDDEEPGGSIMEEFRNYRFRASLLIAECYEDMGDCPKGLAILENARDQHLFHAHCGTCAADADEDLRTRIDDLEKKIANPSVPKKPSTGRS